MPKRPLTKHDIDFLKQLQFELNTQDTVCQRDPRFWVIKSSRVEDVCVNAMPCDHDSVYLTTDYYDDAHIDTVSDLWALIQQTIKEGTAFWSCKFTFEDDALLFETEDDSGCIMSVTEETADVLNDLQTSIGVEFFTVFTRRVEYIEPNTFFLTHKACEEHLKQYAYRYPDNAHAYAMTALNSPEFETLLNLLHTIDFNTFLKEAE